jgi:putative ABC transport system permease protein
MLKNFVMITLRSFLRNWNFTMINILGLSVGIASCIVIFLIVSHELRFDKFHSKAPNTYRVVRNLNDTYENSRTAVTPYPFINAFHNDFPDVPLATQLHINDKVQITYNGEKSEEPGLIFADSMFFRVFDFKVIEGNPNKDLGQPGKIFLTESLAKRLLKPGKGKTLKLNNKTEFEVVGILRDPPAASHIQFSMIASMPSLNKAFLGLSPDTWEMTMSGYSYVVLPDGMPPNDVEKRLEAFGKKYHSPEPNQRYEYHLMPLLEIHFDQLYPADDDAAKGISRSSLVVLSLLGIFILVVACINFVNLSTALAVRKSREIGVRKTLGASRTQLSRQFMSEALLITTVSLLVGIAQVELAIPFIADFLDKPIALQLDASVVLFLVGLTITTTLMAGGYPAIVLSGFSPAVVLKNSLTGVTSSGATARRYLVTFQFFIAQVLIIGTLVVSSQMNFFLSKPLGFNKEAIVNLALPKNDKATLSTLRAQLEGIPGVENVSLALGSPTSNNNLSTNYFLTERGKEETKNVEMKPVDSHYLDTYGLTLAAGRWFNENEEHTNFEADKEENRIFNYIVNEALVKDLGFASNEEIIGKHITSGLNGIEAEVIGVVKDFHTKSLHQNVAPTAMLQYPYFVYDAGVKFRTGDVASVMKGIERVYRTIYPEYLFRYSFLDKQLADLYAEEHRSFTLVRVFAALSIFISCLGLLGLVSFMTHQRMKEVGIRKVFGASVESIVLLFSRGYLRMIVFSFIFAAPTAWYLMKTWLDEFAYRTSIGADVFILALASTAIIALLTVSVQSFRAAVANPVNSLRNE